MLKSTINPMPKFFEYYINLVNEDHIIKALEKSLKNIDDLDPFMLQKIGKKVYAENKWTLHEVFQHLIDNERIQSSRALRIARNENIEHASYDENFFADNSFANDRKLDDIISEFKTLRQSSIDLFSSFRENNVGNIGVCSGIEISVLGLGFQIVGHQNHHFKIIKERYFPLA